MICNLMYTQSHLSIATIVFYTCIYIPFKQMKQSILDMVSSILQQLDQSKGVHDINEQSKPVVLDVFAAKFSEVAEHKHCSAEDGRSNGEGCSDLGESCSICLAEYNVEEMVIKLPRCGHLFHMDCIKSWLDRNQFTCPLCRDLFLLVN